MAVVAVVSKRTVTPITVAGIYLAATGDTLVYTAGMGQELYLFNNSAAAVVVTIDGASGTTVAVPGAAGATLNVSAGLAVSVAANSFAFVPLDNASAYLQGVVAITAATAAVVRAAIVTPY
jgi:hypothetical protein